MPDPSILLAPLYAIICLLKNLAWTLLAMMIIAFNAIIEAVAALLQAAIDLSPIEMPAPPTLPQPFADALAWIAWVFPIGTLVSILTFMLTAWLAWQIIALALRWAKATNA